DADLGRRLDGELGTVTLGQCLHEHEPYGRGWLLDAGVDLEVDVVAVHLEDPALQAHPVPVDDVDPLPRSPALDHTGVAPLGTVEQVTVAGAVALEGAAAGQEDRCGAHRPESLSRRRENTPECAGARRASGRSSPRAAASWRSRAACSSGSSVGTTTRIVTWRSPR